MNIVKELNILLEEFKFEPRNLDPRKEQKEEIDKQLIKKFEEVVFKNFNVSSGEELDLSVDKIIRAENIHIQYGHLLQNPKLYLTFYLGTEGQYSLFFYTSGIVELSKLGGFKSKVIASISETKNITIDNVEDLLSYI